MKANGADMRPTVYETPAPEGTVMRIAGTTDIVEVTAFVEEPGVEPWARCYQLDRSRKIRERFRAIRVSRLEPLE